MKIGQISLSLIDRAYWNGHFKAGLLIVPDVFGPEVRSQIMSCIRGTHTSPERIVRSFLHAQGLRFRLHRRDLPGKPDLVLARFRTVVFVHGCFWHQHKGCKHSGIPKSNRSYWKPKLRRNASRDARNERLLTDAGWAVETIWECETNERLLTGLAKRIRKRLRPRGRMSGGAKSSQGGR